MRRLPVVGAVAALLALGGGVAAGAEPQPAEQGEERSCGAGSETGQEHTERPHCDSGTEGSNECPAQDLDPSDDLFSLQTPAGAVCWDLRDLSFAHVWVDGDDDNPGPLGGYVTLANDGPDHHSDREDEPDDGRSADPPWLCVSDERGPDSGGEDPVCFEGGHPMGDNVGMHPAPEANQCLAWLTGEENDGTERHEAHLCVDDDGSPGEPDPENIPPPPILEELPDPAG